MTGIDDAWEEQRRNRSMRTNAHLYIRHDAYRFMPPGSPIYVGRDVVKYFWPDQSSQPSDSENIAYRPNVVAWTGKRGRWMPENDAALEAEQQRRAAASALREIDELKSAIAKIRSGLAFERFKRTYYYRWADAERLRRKAGYRPEQLRVPANNPGGGQWTREGNNSRTRLAAADKPNLGPLSKLIIALEAAKLAIEAYRTDKGLWDLFRRPDGAVTVTKMNGEDIFGSNSTSPTYRSIDLAEATRLRDRYLEAKPDLAARGNAGFKPNDGFYHAETTVLLRAARANGGTLAGQTLEVFGDTEMCDSCEAVLPFVGRQLGNPTVTFVDPNGKRRTMRDGIWIKVGQQ